MRDIVERLRHWVKEMNMGYGVDCGGPAQTDIGEAIKEIERLRAALTSPAISSAASLQAGPAQANN